MEVQPHQGSQYCFWWKGTYKQKPLKGGEVGLIVKAISASVFYIHFASFNLPEHI